jgi:two-component system OmpR family sensor kinase
VHAVVIAHGGTVAVSSEPGRTVFTVRLPHATVAQHGPEDVEDVEDVEDD